MWLCVFLRKNVSQQNSIFSFCLEHCIDLETPSLNIHTAILIVSFSGHFVYTQSANHSCRQTQSLLFVGLCRWV